MASEAGRAAHAARVIEGLADRTPGDSDGQALEAINQPPGYRVRRPAGPAPKGEGQTRADRAALLTPPIDKGAGTPLLRRDVLRLAALASTGQEEEFAGESSSFAVGLVDVLCGGLSPDLQAKWQTIRAALCLSAPTPSSAEGT